MSHHLYELIDRDGLPGVTCLPCGLTTFHPRDVAERFCPCCGRWLDDPMGPRDAPMGGSRCPHGEAWAHGAAGGTRAIAGWWSMAGLSWAQRWHLYWSRTIYVVAVLVFSWFALKAHDTAARVLAGSMALALAVSLPWLWRWQRDQLRKGRG